jgi:hypothetical protein
LAFPLISGNTQTAETGNSATKTLTYPVSIDSGDLLILFIGHDSVSGTPFGSYPSGWVELYDGANSDHAGAVAYKIADGTESGNFTVTANDSERAHHVTLKITGWHGTTAPELTSNTGNSINPDPPSITPSWGSEDNLIIAACIHDNTDTDWPVVTFPYTNNQIDNSATVSSVGVGICADEDTSTTVNPGTYEMTGTDRWTAWTIAVRPAAAAGSNEIFQSRRLISVP